MKLSIITPTHNPKFLKELESTIFKNTYSNWEWIILLNNGAKYTVNDERVKIIKSKVNSTSVGALKKEACSYATGEIIVEIDHDDLITPDCLEKVANAFEDKEIGFVYSDDAKLADDFKPYNSFYGWKWSYFQWKDKKLIRMHSQPLTPGRLGYIWFAPDHVRAWRKSVYDAIGGHNENLDICDDQDLIHRLYMVTKFKHIPEVLYIYRITGGNTWLERNKAIQEKTVEIYQKNIYPLAFRFSQLNNLMNIDLCGGFNKPPGFTSIDKVNGDIRYNLDEGIPLADGSCGIVRAYDALEHLRNPIRTMQEIHRVLAPGGILLSRTPSTDGRGAWQDPTHCCFSDDTEIFTENGFVLFKDLKKDEYVYTYNDDKKLAELHLPKRYFEYNYEGKMIEWDGRNSNIMVTPNHNMYIGSSDDTTPFRFVQAKDAKKLKSPARLPSNMQFIGDYPEYFEIPDSVYRFHKNPKSSFKGDKIRLKIEPFMEFMGWFLTEGSAIIHPTYKGNIYRISIFQSPKANKKHYDRIGECLKELGYKPYNNKNGWHFTDKYLAIYLKKLGKSPQRYIPMELKQMDVPLLKIIIKSMILGDGNKNGITSFTYASTSKKLASDFQEIAIKCGYRTTLSTEKRIGKIVTVNPDYRSNYDIHRVYISRSKHSYLPRKVTTHDYKGKIYCVEMPENNVILTRRKGKVMWSGNSFWNENSFWYWTRKEQMKFIHNDKQFFESSLRTFFPSEWHQAHNIPYVEAFLEKI